MDNWTIARRMAAETTPDKNEPMIADPFWRFMTAKEVAALAFYTLLVAACAVAWFWMVFGR